MKYALMWFDAIQCYAMPRLARWTVVVVDRMDGEVHPVDSLRMRWESSANEWIKRATADWVRRGFTVHFEAREIEER